MSRKPSEQPKLLAHNSSATQAMPVGERLKNGLSIVQSMLTIAAILIGAVWFLQQGDPFAKATISHEITDRLLGEGNRWIHIAITITNPGKTALALDTGTIRIQQIKPLDSSVTDALASGTPNSIVSRKHYVVYWTMPVEEYSPQLNAEIAPGESDTLYYEFVIPRAIATMKIYSDFSERQTGWILRIYRRIMNPGRESLRWHKTTIYDPKT